MASSPLLAPERTATPGEAESRVVRLIAFVLSLSALAAFALSAGSFFSQWSAYHPWWSVLALIAAIGFPLTLAAGAWLLPVRLIRLIAVGGAIAWLSALALLEAGLAEGALADGSGAPWLIGLTPIPAIAAALALSPTATWIICGALAVFVAVDRMLAFSGTILDVAVQDALVALLVQAVMVALSLAVLRTARALDLGAVHARNDRVLQTRTEALHRERVRTAAIIHDHVLSTLVIAAREPAASHASPVDDDISRRIGFAAAAALAEIDRAVSIPEVGPPGALPGSVDRADASIPAGELVLEVQALTTTLDPRADFSYVVSAIATEVRSDVAEAVLAATAESLRNSVRHAGTDAQRGVRVEIGSGWLRAVILDDGPGFDESAVRADRHGLRVSIRERMRSAGGEARIVTGSGSGVIVDLTWGKS